MNPLVNPLGAIAVLLIAFFCGFGVRGTMAERDLAKLHARYDAALAEALTDARTIEHQFIRDMETLQHETAQQLASITAAERRAADERVRDIAAHYAARHRATTDDPAIAARCTPASTAADVLAELLGELDELAESYAAEADRRRAAGLACEAGYERIRHHEAPVK